MKKLLLISVVLFVSCGKSNPAFMERPEPGVLNPGDKVCHIVGWEKDSATIDHSYNVAHETNTIFYQNGNSEDVNTGDIYGISECR